MHAGGAPRHATAPVNTLRFASLRLSTPLHASPALPPLFFRCVNAEMYDQKSATDDVVYTETVYKCERRQLFFFLEPAWL